MSRRAAVVAAIAVAAAIAGGWFLFVALPRMTTDSPSPPPASSPAPSPPEEAEKRITATLYYVAEDGLSLVGVQREVPFGEPLAEQARNIVTAQLAPAPEPLVSAIPDGTTLRALYITERGDAFVDLAAEARRNHVGGALNELFTVYSIVNALTVNLPAVSRVQILVEGQEVDTLAGHVDLRHPLQKSLKWVRSDKEGP